MYSNTLYSLYEGNWHRYKKINTGWWWVGMWGTIMHLFLVDANEMSFFCFVLLLFLSVGASTFSRNNTQDCLRPMLSSLKIVSVLWAHACRRVCLKWRVCKLLGDIPFEDVRLVEFTYLVLSGTSSESYRGWFRFLLFGVFVAVFMSRVWSTCSVCLSACQKADLIWVHMHPAGTTLATHTEIPVWQNTCDEDTKVS